MKLLLDEMHDPAVARALREADHDVVAVVEIPDLQGVSDETLLALATIDGRAVVTENVKDFAPLHRRWLDEGRDHAGIVFTHLKRFPRGAREARRHLEDALAALLEDPPGSPEPWIWWLAPTR